MKKSDKKTYPGSSHSEWEPYTATDRDELIYKGMRGELSPDELEALELRPDTRDYDPHGEGSWTLTMAIAWIAHRMDDAVRDQWDRYQARCWFWCNSDRVGASGTSYKLCLKQGKPARFWDYITIGEKDDTDQRSDAKRLLWHAMHQGKLTAVGTDNQGKRVEISRYLWPSLDCAMSDRSHDRFFSNLSSEWFEHVTVLSVVVRKLWPERRSTSGEERRCERWLTDRMKEARTPVPKDQLRIEWEAKNGRLPDRAFVRAWGNASKADGVPETWRKAGRRKSNHRTK